MTNLEIVKKLFTEIHTEIAEAVRNNLDVRKECHEDFISFVDGKIMALRGIDDYLDELQKKYEEGLNE